MIIYLSGKMTGLPDYGRSAFEAAARELELRGHVVLSPATLPDGLKYEQYMRIDFAMVQEADAICMLPGWESSNGANAEKEFARELGLPVYFLSNLLAANVGIKEAG